MATRSPTRRRSTVCATSTRSPRCSPPATARAARMRGSRSRTRTLAAAARRGSCTTVVLPNRSGSPLLRRSSARDRLELLVGRLRRRSDDARDLVGLRLDERLVLHQRPHERVELVAVRREPPAAVLVAAFDQPPHLLVDQPPRFLGTLGGRRPQ